MATNPDDNLTPEEEAMLAALQAKRDKQNWSAQEATRLARLEMFGDLKTVLTTEIVSTQVAALEKAITLVDRETSMRLERLSQMLRYDGLAVAQTIEMLSQPTPEPGSTSV